MTAPPLQGPTSVYALYGADGRLLYIGVARVGRERDRWEEHRRNQQWWPAVHTRHIVGIYPSRMEALAAEASLIRSAKPLYNRIHNSANPRLFQAAGPLKKQKAATRRRSPWLLAPLVLLLSVFALLSAPRRGSRGTLLYRVVRRLQKALKRRR